jgi:hypothetical protein
MASAAAGKELLPHHRARIEASAIASEVAAERGYMSVASERGAKAYLGTLGFAEYQRHVPALLIPVYNVHGALATHQIRPDDPRLDKDHKAIKYETPTKSRLALDVPSRARHWLPDITRPLFITEGARKVDALLSVGACAIGVLGVWGWKGKNEHDGKAALPDWNAVPLNRTVYICYDSDAMSKVPVQRAVAALYEYLKMRDADVRVIYLPPGEGGKKQGVDDYLATGATLTDVLSHATTDLRVTAGLLTKTAGEMLTDCPEPEFIVPAPYILSATQTARMDVETDVQPFAHAPVVIAKRLKNTADGSESLAIRWLHDGEWPEIIESRAVLMNSRDILSLASVGFPVTSGSARALTDYIAATEAANRARLPVEHVSSHLGWQKGGGFLWGRTFLDNPHNEGAAPINFRGAQQGDEQVADGFTARGSISAWWLAVRLALAFPRARLALFAAFAAPLLDILNVPNFGIDFSNRTSTGKTTVLRIAASVWGNPDERTPNSVIGTWNATPVYLERAGAVQTHIPMFLDDTKQAKAPWVVEQIVYLLAGGKGRGRGTLGGVAKTVVWRTVMFSTGEQPITAFTQAGGTRTRVLQIAGMPFGTPDERTGKIVDAINQGVVANYGKAGPEFVRYLLEHRAEDEGEWRATYDYLREAYAARATGEEGKRLADYAAAIALAGRLAYEAEIFEGEYCDSFGDGLWESIAAEAQGAGGAERALREFVGYAQANDFRFVGRATNYPLNGYLGRWEEDKPDNLWTHLAIHPHVLKETLAKMGYEPEAILRDWKGRGWLDTDADGVRFTKKMSVNGQKSNLIAIRRDAIETICG